ncbi:hypothetical protein GCM10018793_67950 [Streptomyces sulfonofaciens]|uniref:Allene oxide cyclase barrel-like domain-containing protein n=1 Tax=Streptomyces sulfonofaciens TaxID=68272 RepID=A0A919L830_9ACTN|nr:hypothetical protein [Streptomyces sulfonofaciens]GHH88405.1 hypothetical protein GCM10018793_67950 [Streptomyces sulfonofaciens]
MTTADNGAQAKNTAGIDERAVNSGAAFQQAEPDPGPVDIRALAVAAATRAGRYVAGRDTVDDAVAACVARDGLTEKILKLRINDGGQEGLGTTVDYEDAILDAGGTEIGKSTSSAVVLSMTPHMWQIHRSTVELADGSYESSGLLDVHAMMRGMTQILQVTGVSGRYEGKSGYATITIGDPTQKPPSYAISFAVC